MTLTKAELADHLYTALGLTKLVARDLVDLVFEEVRKALEQGQTVKLSGFGNFELRDKYPRPGRNPKTGEQKMVSARRVVTFKAGQKLKAQVEKYQGEQE